MSLALEPWPLCSRPGCDNEVNPARIARARLTTCLDCGSPAARLFIIDMPKSTPIVTADLGYARGIGSSHKGNRQVL